MTSASGVGRVLVLACGNPSRGDDALGPLLIERLSLDPDLARCGVETLTDFQLQIEHVLDLQGRERVIFVDAAVSGPEPFTFLPVRPSPDASFSTHALAPSALLALFQQVNGQAPPPARLLAIRGYGFELGAPLTEHASANLDRAQHLLTRILRLDRLPVGPG
ncbi:hydrogenase maturation protease [Thiocapsa roseopersicina]|uniref:Hydrogenase maturation protease n=1 Tax=Thiocapsa roseopersicina TaxID=1058 RepID=A0A1H2RWA7_THIRO|nr:hydrogenase maturation protease [Thiocapsa roseopersicina]SDW23763.1 hydrogenase maturation protease [Thiocapsa roseopersicina]